MQRPPPNTVSTVRWNSEKWAIVRHDARHVVLWHPRRKVFTVQPISSSSEVAAPADLTPQVAAHSSAHVGTSARTTEPDSPAEAQEYERCPVCLRAMPSRHRARAAAMHRSRHGSTAGLLLLDSNAHVSTTRAHEPGSRPVSPDSSPRRTPTPAATDRGMPMRDDPANASAVYHEQYFALLAGGGIDTHDARSEALPDPAAAASHAGLSDALFNDGYYSRFFSETCLLGRGGYGAVYLVQHVLDSVDLGLFAVKKLPIGDDRAWLNVVMREVATFQRFTHPNVLEYKHAWVEHAQPADFGPTVPCMFILMAYANGGTLSDYLTSRPLLDESEVWAFLLDICAGLDYLHSLGVIHRDLKPQNLLLHTMPNHDTPSLLISDFGTSDVATHRSATGHTGTVEYTAPELFAHHACSSKSDMWSVGVILYLMAYGQLPFQGPERDQVVAQISRHSSVQYPTNVPRRSAQLEAVIECLLSPRPVARASASDILDRRVSIQSHFLHPRRRTSSASPTARSRKSSAVDTEPGAASSALTPLMASSPAAAAVPSTSAAAAAVHAMATSSTAATATTTPLLLDSPRRFVLRSDAGADTDDGDGDGDGESSLFAAAVSDGVGTGSSADDGHGDVNGTNVADNADDDDDQPSSDGSAIAAAESVMQRLRVGLRGVETPRRRLGLPSLRDIALPDLPEDLKAWRLIVLAILAVWHPMLHLVGILAPVLAQATLLAMVLRHDVLAACLALVHASLLAWRSSSWLVAPTVLVVYLTGGISHVAGLIPMLQLRGQSSKRKTS